MGKFRGAWHLIRFGSEPREEPEKVLREGTAPTAARGSGAGKSGVSAKSRLLNGGTQQC